MIEIKFTGRTRYRELPRVLGHSLLVLQVEVRFGDGPPDSNGMPLYLKGATWRDAKVEDLSFLVPQQEP